MFNSECETTLKSATEVLGSVRPTSGGDDFRRNVVHNHGSVIIFNGGLQLKLFFNHRAEHPFREGACVLHGVPQIDAAAGPSVFRDKEVLSQKPGRLFEM